MGWCKIYITSMSKVGERGTRSVNLKLAEKSETYTGVPHASQRSYCFEKAPVVRQLNLDVFKVYLCNIGTSHNHKQCVNYHNAKDKKRPHSNYYSVMCPLIKKGEKCPDGEACPYAHSFVEEHYHPSEYKRKFCSHFPNSVDECAYGDFCSYAHSEMEIITPLIHNYAEDDDFYMFHYKTEKCPFNLTKHEPALCVYWHNLQDYRRKPHQYNYEPMHCLNWKMKEHINDYSEGCEMGANCQMSHGWKEQQYHPNSYKTNKCEVPGCKKGSCPNYHSAKEQRHPDPAVLNRAFKFVPKNRVVEGTYKSPNLQGYQTKHPQKTKTAAIKPQARHYESPSTSKGPKTLVMVKEKSDDMEESQAWIASGKPLISDSDEEEVEDEQVSKMLGLDE